jgi:16S rRNA (guanine527-N7)-methyltransferase
LSDRAVAGAGLLHLEASLADAAKALHLSLSSEQSARLLEFVELLLRWNRTYNLTAVRGGSDMLTHHVVDCLAAVLPLRRMLSGPAPRRILDVGSGGGLPGVVFAVMQGEDAVTCVDSVGKKVAFVRQVAGSLGLGNLDARHARVEAISDRRFDLITARAFASLVDLTRLTAGLLADSGTWMAMKGKTPADEILALPPSVEVFHVEPLSVPGLHADRCLVWMRESHRPSGDGEE